MTTLAARVVVERPDFTLDVSLEVDAGTTLAVLGPNGAGKTTLVETLAGLLPITAGRIMLDGEVLDAPNERVFVPPEDRHIGVVFQDYVLFPHMTVTDNIAFGLHGTGRSRSEIETIVTDWLADLGMSELADRRPADLSGGQAQRVALARALATDPDLLLLDEPLAALDVTTRATLRRSLAGHLDAVEAPRLLITHDPTEAFLLADRIAILEEGAVTQAGAPDDIRLRPRTPYAADLAGLNLLEGDISAGTVRIGEHEIHVADRHTAGSVLVAIHPRAIALYPDRPEGSPRNTWKTRIQLIENLGERVRVQLGSPLPITAEITPGSVEALGLKPGVPVWVSIKATEIDIVAR